MRTFLAAFAVMALTSGAAQAYCPSVPDDAGSRYVENGLARSVCLQDELDYETRRRAVDSQVDAASGTVKAKAIFDNPAGTLWPGAFVNVRMTARQLKDATVIPQASIIQSARGDIVYVVQDGKAQPRPIQLVHAEGEMAAVTGVKPGDPVVLDGRQNLRPGSAVAVRPRDGAARPASAAAPSQKASAP